jgi:hypothetical protein
MRQTARTALARSVNELTEALGDDGDVEAAAEAVRERLGLLLERDSLEADQVERFDSGARVRVNMTRGSSPRDQDSWTIEGEGQTHDDAAREFDELLGRYEEEWADRVRELDPYDED